MDDNILIFPTDKPIRADAARNRDHLLLTARRLFQEQGVAEVTMSAIAKEAEVGKGTLYRHFADKAAICHALLDEAMREFQNQTLRRVGHDNNPLVTLRWFLQSAAEYVHDHSDLLCEAAQQSPNAMLDHPAHFWWRQTIRALLVQSQIEGDLDYLADVFYVMLDVQVVRFQNSRLGYSQVRITEGLMLLLDQLT